MSWSKIIFHHKYYLRPAHGIRVLIDLGSLKGEHNSRLFKFKEQKSKGILLKTEARVIAMNAGAAGSGGKSEIYHGRFGDVVTVQLDLILKKSTLIKNLQEFEGKQKRLVLVAS